MPLVPNPISCSWPSEGIKPFVLAVIKSGSVVSTAVTRRPQHSWDNRLLCTSHAGSQKWERQKEMLRKEFRNKSWGKGKPKAGSSFSAISHQFYCHKTHGNLRPQLWEWSHGVLRRSTSVGGSLVTLGSCAVWTILSKRQRQPSVLFGTGRGIPRAYTENGAWKTKRIHGVLHILSHLGMCRKSFVASHSEVNFQRRNRGKTQVLKIKIHNIYWESEWTSQGGWVPGWISIICSAYCCKVENICAIATKQAGRRSLNKWWSKQEECGRRGSLFFL